MNPSVEPIEIEYEFSLRPDSDENLSDYVLRFEGRATTWDEEEGAERIVGEIRGYRVDLVAALHDGLEFVALLDLVAAEVSDFGHAVLDGKDCLLPESELHEIEAVECEGIVYIGELRVEPDFRGQGIGSALLQRMGTMIDITHCLIALKAFPLADDYGKAAAPEEVARVKRYYERHGFTHAGEEFMVKDGRLCEAMKKKLARRRAAGAKPPAGADPAA